jgi:hypothetical protein
MMLNHYRQRLRITLGSSAAPYGYTLSTWTTGAVLTQYRGLPDALAALTFMFGAILGFAFVGTLAFGGVTRHFDRDHDETPLVWGSFHFFSVGVAIGAAVLVSYLVERFIFAWPLGGFLSTATYLLVAGAEATIAYEWDHRGER